MMNFPVLGCITQGCWRFLFWATWCWTVEVAQIRLSHAVTSRTRSRFYWLYFLRVPPDLSRCTARQNFQIRVLRFYFLDSLITKPVAGMTSPFRFAYITGCNLRTVFVLIWMERGLNCLSPCIPHSIDCFRHVMNEVGEKVEICLFSATIGLYRLRNALNSYLRVPLERAKMLLMDFLSSTWRYLIG